MQPLRLVMINYWLAPYSINRVKPRSSEGGNKTRNNANNARCYYSQHDVSQSKRKVQVEKNRNNLCAEKYNQKPYNSANKGKNNRFKKKFKKNEISFSTKRFLYSYHICPFLNRNKHNICYPKTTNKN